MAEFKVQSEQHMRINTFNLELQYLNLLLRVCRMHRTVSRHLNCIPEAWQIAFLKRDGSQSHTPPTENMHCKISSLTLRHSAIIISTSPLFIQQRVTEVVDSVSYTTGSEMVFPVNYHIYNVNYLVCTVADYYRQANCKHDFGSKSF